MFLKEEEEEENSSTSRHKNIGCARERDADRKRAHAWREIVSKKKKRSLAVGVSFSELLLRVFFVVSSKRFLKGTFTLLKRCSRDFWEKLEVKTRGI